MQDPGLPPLPLIGAAESEFNKPCTMIGYGVGKGTAVPNQAGTGAKTIAAENAGRRTPP
ncbi:MAG: hypothetical protein WDN28_01870 [Chthoniobacter sp.]